MGRLSDAYDKLWALSGALKKEMAWNEALEVYRQLAVDHALDDLNSQLEAYRREIDPVSSEVRLYSAHLSHLLTAARSA